MMFRRLGLMMIKVESGVVIATLWGRSWVGVDVRSIVALSIGSGAYSSLEYCGVYRCGVCLTKDYVQIAHI